MEHRGGCGGDGDSGDGSGILCTIPWGYLKQDWKEINSLDSNKPLGLGMIFMPRELQRREEARKFCEKEAQLLGITSEGCID